MEPILYENFIRVVNVRGDEDFQPTEDEKVIVGHRANPILGNSHVMKSKSLTERDLVIKKYKEDVLKDIEQQGEKYKLLLIIAKDIVNNNQKIALSCFCAPAPCHLSVLLPIIIEMANNYSVEKQKKQKIGGLS